MSDDGLHDDPEPWEPEVICPGCEGPLDACVCEDEDFARGGTPEMSVDGDLPHRNTGDSSALVKKEREEWLFTPNGQAYLICSALGCGCIATHGAYCERHK